jgi:hypothetical protein
MKRSAIHPGEHLAEQLEELGMSAADLAEPSFPRASVPQTRRSRRQVATSICGVGWGQIENGGQLASRRHRPAESRRPRLVLSERQPHQPASSDCFHRAGGGLLQPRGSAMAAGSARAADRACCERRLHRRATLPGLHVCRIDAGNLPAPGSAVAP